MKIEDRRIRLMTRLAVMETEHRKEIRQVKRTCRSDYIGARMLKNGIRITAVYVLVLLVWFVSRAEVFFQSIGGLDLPGVFRAILLAYVVLMAAGLILTYLAAGLSYDRDKQLTDRYRQNLSELKRCYEQEKRRGGQRNERDT